ncbi:Na/Pi cotransporter family protein [Caldibacillus lycopersici]|uniref:Na/Pi cotransporter family protein n=1 Tax=Perspicuibacillus lycopersici TaxID=1325689 RepID=A0AAE3LNI5_9BACI|nr:Na/Pi cotransporter family protein [Perspicuibacillus lycopersici]MCU9613887.1 Na/Pi cotransporter family protein [Perspicuibacillus lycopersici]
MNEINIQQMIFEFLGGLGIFLFGIKAMGEGLQKSAGDRLRDILDKFTTNPVMGVLAGMVVTILIQSSSATTVITVGLVSAGFMTLRQAIGVIMGANIGTTITAFIIGIDVGEFALPILALGSFLLFFFKSKRVHYIGQILFGFGALFFGLELMSGGMKPLRDFELFHELTVSMSENRLLGVLVGTIFTVVVQSSSATIGILQSLFADGLLDIKAALPVLFGDNIGTTITAILAAIGASVAAKRAALSHVLFNVIGTIIFLIILGPFTMFIEFLQDSLNLNEKMVIAFAHGTFNITNTIIQLPFIGLLALIVTKLIPGDDSFVDTKAKQLDPMFIDQSPSIALGAAKEEVIRMGQLAIKGLEESKNYLTTRQSKHAEMALNLEDAINNLDNKITDYLIKLSSASLLDHESEMHSMLLDTVRDIERIGDHFENIVELSEYQINNKVKLSDFAKQDIEAMFELAVSTVKEVIDALDHNDSEKAKSVIRKEAKIDQMERQLRKQHILRTNEGICSAQAGIVFVDLVINLERIGDHSVNIAEAILGIKEHQETVVK